MNYLLRIFLLLTFSFCCSCASIEKGKSEWEDSTIEFSRGSCFGMCPVYMLTIHGNGKVYYNGYSHTKPGVDSTTISKEAVDFLFGTLKKNGFNELESQYLNTSIPDLPTATISLYHLDTKKTVQHTSGISTAPKWVNEFDYTIDSIVNVERWTTQK